MVVVVIAAILSALALFSGIAAVGSGENWKFTTKDIFKGRRNAVLYVWVTASSIFSLFHTVANVSYIASPTWGVGFEIQFWFALHAIVAALLTGAHAIIYLTLTQANLLDTYFWGND